MRPSRTILRWALLAPSALILGLSLAHVRPSWLLPPLTLLALGILGYLVQDWLLARLSLGRVERLTLGLTSGLVALILVAFPLALFAQGFSSPGWATALLLLTLVARRGAGRVTSPPSWYWPKLGDAWPQALLATLVLGLAGVAVVIALRLASAGALSAPYTGHTLLWLLPEDEQGLHFRVGVRNAEHMPVTYRLQVRVDGARLYEWSSLEFEPQEARVYDVPLAVEHGSPDHIEVWLFRSDAPDQIYRRVDYWRAVPTPAP